MKKYIVYFVVAYFWGVFLQVLIDLFRGVGFSDVFVKENIPWYCLAGFIFAILVTLFKCLEERRARRK